MLKLSEGVSRRRRAPMGPEPAVRTSWPARSESPGAVLRASTVPSHGDGLVPARREASGPRQRENRRDRISPAIRRLVEPERPLSRRVSRRRVRQEHRRQARVPSAASALGKIAMDVAGANVYFPDVMSRVETVAAGSSPRSEGVGEIKVYKIEWKKIEK